MTDNYQIRAEDALKIIDWWCNGMLQIGGTLDLFLKAGVEYINKNYNVTL